MSKLREDALAQDATWVLGRLQASAEKAREGTNLAFGQCGTLLNSCHCCAEDLAKELRRLASVLDAAVEEEQAWCREVLDTQED